MFPVASPLHFGEKAPPTDAAGLLECRLLGMPRASGDWLSWGEWFTEAGVPLRGRLRTTDFDNYALVVNAALAGQGVCLCWAGLLQAFLAAGTLVRLGDVSVRTRRGYYITYDEDVAEDSTTAALARWISAASRGRPDEG